MSAETIPATNPERPNSALHTTVTSNQEREAWHAGLMDHLAALGYEHDGIGQDVQKRMMLTKDIHNYIHADLVGRKPDEQRLPDQLIQHRIDRYYKKFPTRLGNEQDSIRHKNQLQFLQYEWAFADTYRRSFREIRIAARAAEDFRTSNHIDGADAADILLAAYGLTLKDLETMSHTAISDDKTVQ